MTSLAIVPGLLVTDLMCEDDYLMIRFSIITTFSATAQDFPYEDPDTRHVSTQAVYYSCDSLQATNIHINTHD